MNEINRISTVSSQQFRSETRTSDETVMGDPRMGKQQEPPFDSKRTIYGGLQRLLGE
jgi:uncharacterized protein YbaA (DUF1428 family)